MIENVSSEISQQLKLDPKNVSSCLELLKQDNTVPFIARYRKEKTGGLNEVEIRDIRDLYEYVTSREERKNTILKSIQEQGKLTPDLESKIKNCKSKTLLEDIYLPFKPKRKTKGFIAQERGLAIPAEIFLSTPQNISDLNEFLALYVGTHKDLTSPEIVKQGMCDFISELWNENSDFRKVTREWLQKNASLSSKVTKEFAGQKSKFTDYYEYSEPLASIPSHRIMALRRGEKENILSVKLDFDEVALNQIHKDFLFPASFSSLPQPVQDLYLQCLSDCSQKHLIPSLETEIRLESRGRAEEDAIHVFSKNLRHLLLLPPLPQARVLGIDPGIRTGSKVAVCDETGKLLAHQTFNFILDRGLEGNNLNLGKTLVDLIQNYKITTIAIGNGTGCREVEHLVDSILRQFGVQHVRVLTVNESGASVYSASDLAREEFPNLDIVYRGAVSIARRLQDPLAEFVKIDPKSIGVGQYQHDVNQIKLKRSLEDVVESCVNYVGVNLNTASYSLLSYVAGVGPTLAKNIVNYRNEHGAFQSRETLMNVPNFGPKTYEQAAGFLKIPDAANPLDSSNVHPESYKIVETIAQDCQLSLKDLLGNKESIEKITVEKYVNSDVGLITLQDILKELKKPGRDPRVDGTKRTYTKEVRDFSQLKIGQILEGTVSNVTNFGAFVDIGVHQDGLIHISELAHEFIKNPADVVSVGQPIKVKIIEIDVERKRINLSIKALTEAPAQKPGAYHNQPRPHQDQRQQNNRPRNNQQPQQYQQQQRPRKQEKPQQPSTMENLLDKFNSRRI